MPLIMIFLSLRQTVEHGFPHQPSALGYSPFLRLMAIGTRSGAIKLYSFEQLWLGFSDYIRMCNFEDTVKIYTKYKFASKGYWNIGTICLGFK